jgi:hypothetical protein
MRRMNLARNSLGESQTVDPSLVSRCFACEGAELWRTSERLLELVFGASAP